jgi:hypothetical protein
MGVHMDRRDFLQTMAVAAASLEVLGASSVTVDSRLMALAKRSDRPSGDPVSTDRYTLVCEFKRRSMLWKVYEDLRTRGGSIVFVSSAGETRELTKSSEASMAEGTAYLGLTLKQVSLSSAEVNFKLRLPLESKLRNVTVNGHPAKLSGPHGGTVIIATGGEKKFEIVAQRA